MLLPSCELRDGCFISNVSVTGYIFIGEDGRRTIQGVNDPEQETAQGEGQRNNEEEEDKCRAGFELQLDDADGVED